MQCKEVVVWKDLGGNCKHGYTVAELNTAFSAVYLRVRPNSWLSADPCRWKLAISASFIRHRTRKVDPGQKSSNKADQADA